MGETFDADVGVPYDKINVYGGAIALGHPVGCSEARIIVTLLNALQEKGGKRGMASLCQGPGAVPSWRWNWFSI